MSIMPEQTGCNVHEVWRRCSQCLGRPVQMREAYLKRRVSSGLVQVDRHPLQHVWFILASVCQAGVQGLQSLQVL